MLDPTKHPWLQENETEVLDYVKNYISSLYDPGMIVWFPVYMDDSDDSDYYTYVLVIQNGYRMYDSRGEAEHNAVLRGLEYNGYENQTLGLRLTPEKNKKPMAMTKRAKQLMLEVSETAGVPAEAFTRPGRVLKAHTKVRNLLWHRIHDELGYSVSTIARMFERDPSTVDHGIMKHRYEIWTERHE